MSVRVDETASHDSDKSAEHVKTGQDTRLFHRRRFLGAAQAGQEQGAAVFAPPFRLGAWSVILSADIVGLVGPAMLIPGARISSLCFAALVVALLFQAGLYRPRLHLSVLDDSPLMLSRGLAAMVAGGVVVAALSVPTGLPRFIRAAAVALVSLLVLRVVAYRFIGAVRAKGGATHRTLLLGGGLVAGQLARSLRERPQYGLRPVGFLDVDPLIDASDATSMRYLGEVAQLASVLEEQQARVVIVAFGNLPESAMVDVLRGTDLDGVEVFIVPRLYEAFGGNGPFRDHIGAIPVERVGRSPRRGVSWRIKRLIDIAVASAGLLVLSPLMIAIALAVRWEGGKGVLFRQVRVGRDGRHFELLKFRSMRPASPDESETRWNISQDSRIGPVGRLLRRSSMDELPQLLNILRGEMSLVGPRPERPHFVDQFSAVHPRYFHRHRVPCGLTGLAQVSGYRGDTSIADRIRYDNYYIENWSLWFDVKIMLMTVREVLGARGG